MIEAEVQASGRLGIWASEQVVQEEALEGPVAVP